MVAAYLGANVLATDMDLTATERALARNQETLAAARGRVATDTLAWGDTWLGQPLSAVLVADVLYKEACLVPLATQLAAIVAASKVTPRILLAYQRRDREMEQRFFGLLCEKSLSYRQLPMD